MKQKKDEKKLRTLGIYVSNVGCRQNCFVSLSQSISKYLVTFEKLSISAGTCCWRCHASLYTPISIRLCNLSHGQRQMLNHSTTLFSKKKLCIMDSLLVVFKSTKQKTFPLDEQHKKIGCNKNATNNNCGFPSSHLGLVTEMWSREIFTADILIQVLRMIFFPSCLCTRILSLSSVVVLQSFKNERFIFSGYSCIITFHRWGGPYQMFIVHIFCLNIFFVSLFCKWSVFHLQHLIFHNFVPCASLGNFSLSLSPNVRHHDSLIKIYTFYTDYNDKTNNLFFTRDGSCRLFLGSGLCRRWAEKYSAIQKN